MLANKQAGVANWHHPASLGGSGGSYANGSLPQRTQQAALAVLAFCWSIYRGGRPAELFRMRWFDASVLLPGQEVQLPLFVLGLSGLLPMLQEAAGTGWWFSGYHCKVRMMLAGYGSASFTQFMADTQPLFLQHGFGYGVPDCIDFLPASMSGLDLGACFQLAFVALAFLQPQSPAKPISRKRAAPGQQQQTFNNAGGFVFGQYGGLKHLEADDDEQLQAEAMAKLVNAAISCASFFGKGWGAFKGPGKELVQRGGATGVKTWRQPSPN